MPKDLTPAFGDLFPDAEPETRSQLRPVITEPEPPGPLRRLAARMQKVKHICENAPPDGKQSASLRYYQSAERARVSGDEAECIRRLEAAEKALA
ncbi:hypothetical protein [Hyphomonas sp.]|uniref:hypothetical protein n=1 Tax=Hyphomonas sp. TaxID=87 RepID=UPI00333F1686